MSLSDPSKDHSFQAASWQSLPTADAVRSMESAPGGQGKPAGGFRPISIPKRGVAATQEFVSPYVSEEKLRQINAASRKLQPIPEPDPEEIARKAYEKGFAQGEAAGLAAGQEKAKEIVGQLQNILTDVGGLWQHLLVNYETQMIGLVCRIAEKVVYGQVEIDQEVVKRAILEAFSVIPEPVGVTIEVNSKDYDYIETVKEDFFHHIASLKDVSVAPSLCVARGGCHIITRTGEVDASLETRLDAVRKAIVEANGKAKG